MSFVVEVSLSAFLADALGLMAVVVGGGFIDSSSSRAPSSSLVGAAGTGLALVTFGLVALGAFSALGLSDLTFSTFAFSVFVLSGDGVADASSAGVFAFGGRGAIFTAVLVPVKVMAVDVRRA